MSERRAAHFLLVPELSTSPPNEAMIASYLEHGLGVDLFAPGGTCDTRPYGDRVRVFDVAYGRRWLVRNALKPAWRRYSVFSGTSEDPLAVVGVLAQLAGRPSIALVDEIRSGTYRGNAPEAWKRLARRAMRRARLAIVNDESRVALLRDYAAMPAASRIIVYPGGFRAPPAPVDRAAQRKIWGLPEGALAVGYSGVLNANSGADWVIDAMQAADFHIVLQAVGLEPFTVFLLERIAGHERIYVQRERQSWADAWSQSAAMDIGVVIYRSQAPQFQNMGISSNRLCMFLAMGVPVIATRQPSFRFIEDYDCGVLIDGAADFAPAVARIRPRLAEMRANALACWRDYVDTPRRYRELGEAIGRAIG